MAQMNDKELLEMAAKAAGVANFGYTEHFCGLSFQPHPLEGKTGMLIPAKNGISQTLWNPLTDDGDALRLAVKLRICIEFSYCADDAPVIYCGQVEERRDWPMEANFPDPYATTCRAIVRAAAAIGESL